MRREMICDYLYSLALISAIRNHHRLRIERIALYAIARTETVSYTEDSGIIR